MFSEHSVSLWQISDSEYLREDLLGYLPPQVTFFYTVGFGHCLNNVGFLNYKPMTREDLEFHSCVLAKRYIRHPTPYLIRPSLVPSLLVPCPLFLFPLHSFSGRTAPRRSARTARTACTPPRRWRGPLNDAPLQLRARLAGRPAQGETQEDHGDS